MHWVLALVAAIVGAGLAENENLFGAIAAFGLALLALAMQRQRADLSQAQRELAALKARLVALAPAAQATASPARDEPGRRAADSTSSPARADALSPAAPAPDAATASPRPPPLPASTPPPRPASPRPPPSSGPDWSELALARLKHWFTEGNVPVKIGVLVLLFGVAAALRLAAARGYFTLSVETRLAVIAFSALAGLAWGWRERLRRPAFGLSLQGGALGVLLLTVFAAFRLYSLLPAGLALGLVVVLVAGSALLAVLQKTMSLAVLGFLGGYLAPVLISTGSGNHVALFSYYAVLNLAVFAISWRQSWRLLNLIGFFFTFGVGAAWGARYYRPEMYASVQGFLLLFFLAYLAIGLSYVLRQTDKRRPWVDGTLVFGTPLVAFPLQAGLLRDDRFGLALSALLVALVYVGLVAWLRRHRGERLLTEAYGALALGFATLAVPLAFSAGTSASLWALEGAGVAWLGLRQQRRFPWLAGLALQGLAAVAYLIAQEAVPPTPAPDLLLANGQWLGAVLLALSGFVLALMHDRHEPRFALPALLFVWACGWWAVAGLLEAGPAAQTDLGSWRFLVLYLGVSAWIAVVLRDLLAWPRLEWLLGLIAVAGILLVPLALFEYDSPLSTPTLGPWLVLAAALLWALSRPATRKSPSLAVLHLALLWTVALAFCLHLQRLATEAKLADGWRFMAVMAPLVLISLGLWRRPAWLAWPRPEAFVSQYRQGWFLPAMALLAAAFLFGLFQPGNAAPLAYVPLLNPLDLSLLAIAALVSGLLLSESQLRPLARAWPVPALALASLATLRAVHQLHGEPWSPAILDSGFSQASLTVVWSLLGVVAWVRGSRRRDRTVWTGGAILMAAVLLKLLLVDRSYMGNVPGIVSFMAVGLLLVGVGYVAPSPPRATVAAPAP